MKKIAISILIFFTLIIVVYPNKIEAKTLQDLYNQLAKLQAEYNANKNNRDLTQAEINKLNNEINTISATIEKHVKK